MMNQQNSLQMQLQNNQGNQQQQQMMQQQQNQQVPGLISQLQSGQPMLGPQQKMNPMFAQQSQQQQNQQNQNQLQNQPQSQLNNNQQQMMNNQRVNQMLSSQQQQGPNSNQQIMSQMGNQPQMLVQQNGNSGTQGMQNNQQQMQQQSGPQGPGIQGQPMFQQTSMRMVNANGRMVMSSSVRMPGGGPNNQMNIQPRSMGPRAQVIGQQQQGANQPGGPILLQQGQQPVSVVFQQQQGDNMNSQAQPQQQRMNLVRSQGPSNMQQMPGPQGQQAPQGQFQQNIPQGHPNMHGVMNNNNNMQQLNNNHQQGPQSGPGNHSQISSILAGKSGPNPNLDSGPQTQVMSNQSGQQQQPQNGVMLPNGMQSQMSGPNNMNMGPQASQMMNQQQQQQMNQQQPSPMGPGGMASVKGSFMGSQMRMVLNNSIPQQPSPLGNQPQVSPQHPQQPQMMQQARLQVPQQQQIINANQMINSPQNFAVPSPMTPVNMLGSPGGARGPINHMAPSPSGPINTPASPANRDLAAGHVDPPMSNNSSNSYNADDEAAYIEKLKNLQKYTPMVVHIIRQWEKDPRKCHEVDRIKHMYSVMNGDFRVNIQVLEGYEKFILRYENTRKKPTLPVYSAAEMSPSQVPAPKNAINGTAVPNASLVPTQHPAQAVTPSKLVPIPPAPLTAPPLTPIIQPEIKFGEWQSTVDLLRECVVTPGLSGVTGRALGPALSIANRDPPSPKSDYVLFNGLSVIQKNTVSFCKNEAMPALKRARFDNDGPTRDEFCQMLQRELKQLRHEDFEFEPLHKAGDGGKSHHLVCRLKKPMVPKITVYISDKYPDVAPYHEFNSREYKKGTQKLRQIYQHFENLVLDHSDTFTFTGLMYDWRKAVNMFTPSQPMIRVGFLQPVQPEEV